MKIAIIKTPLGLAEIQGDANGISKIHIVEQEMLVSQENPTELIDWGKSEKIPQSQIRAAVVKHALPSGAKVNLINPGKGKGSSKFVGQRKFN